MRRKFLSVVLCVCMMLTMAPFAFAEGETGIGETEIVTTNPPSSDSGSEAGSGAVTPTAGITTEDALKNAISAASENETITLGGSITLTAPIIITKKITLNMAGHTFSNTQDIWNDNKNPAAWSFISVQKNGDLTITGNGTFQTKANDCYAVDIQDATAKCTIENGTFVGNVHAIYVFEGSLFVNGGTYSIQQKYTNANQADEFVLNCYDANRRNGSATISVSGGSFINFDPANCQAEGIATNFCADGYTTTPTTNSGETIYTVGTGTNNSVANAGANYNALQSAINSVEANSSSTQTVTLLKDVVAEDITIPSDKTVTLNLNGKKLTNVSSNTITNNGTLTITGEGTVDNVTHAKAAIYNKGTVTLNGGTYDRSNEDGVDANNAGTNTYYTILNHGNMTVDSSVTVRNKGHHSSLFENGYYSHNSKDGIDNPTLTITSGTYEGGLNTIKNDDDATLIINGGTFTNYTQAAFQNHGTATVTAGSFIANSKYAIDNCGCDATHDPGKLEISGGTFNGTLYIRSAYSNVTISDGYFNGSISKTGGTLTITGGYFTTDPSAYCVENKTGVATGEADYPYTVGDKKADSQPATVDSATVPANTTSTDATVIAAANSISGASVTNNNATEAATRDIANNNTITATTEIKVGSQKKTVTKALSDAMSEGSTNKPSETNPVAIVYQTYVDVTVTDAKKDSSNLTELTVNLTPMYRVVATTKNVTDIKVKGDSGVLDNEANAILIENANKLNVPAQAYEVTLALPSNFDTTDNKLSIKHTKGNGSVEYYTGTVTTDENSNKFVTFTTNGFSPFVIYAASANVASIGDGANKKVYPTLQAAIDAVQNNETITLLKDTNENVTVSKAVKFTLNKDGKGFTGSISAGSRYSVTSAVDSNDSNKTTYTVTYVGGSSSSGSTSTTYNVNVNAATNGAVAADKKTASKGTTVTVTASPSKGYVVDAVKVVDKDGKDVAVTEKDGKYVFTMPASAVTVTGSFKAETPAPVALPFTDVKSGNWFYDAVKYAYAQGLMTGTSATTFAPNGTMNRAMIVTVLYRLEKSPAVTGASKFTDVPAGQWYSDAVAWAAANKIVNGYDETTFGPMNAVTREQMAAILFRYEQVKGLENVTLEENLNRFPDQNKISAYAIPALQWAVGQKIINGNADGTLDPTGTATRAQVAQIFTNLLNK